MTERQLRTTGKGSIDDFGCCIASRSVPAPRVKEIRESVPFMDGSWDFSAIFNGRPYFESMTVTYEFDMIAAGPEELQRLKSALLTWLWGVRGARIEDGYTPGGYFIGTIDNASAWEEELELKGTLRASFLTDPFLYFDRSLDTAVPAGGAPAGIISESPHPVPLLAAVSGSPFTLEISGAVHRFGAGATQNPAGIMLEPGLNAAVLTADAPGTVSLLWRDERFV